MPTATTGEKFKEGNEDPGFMRRCACVDGTVRTTAKLVLSICSKLSTHSSATNYSKPKLSWGMPFIDAASRKPRRRT